MGFDGSELNEVKGVCELEGAIVDPKDSDRFISGGESSEETVRRLLGGVLYGWFAIVQRRGGEFAARQFAEEGAVGGRGLVHFVGDASSVDLLEG